VRYASYGVSVCCGVRYASYGTPMCAGELGMLQ
jgi:hypothetical protein